MDFAVEIYAFTRRLPHDERFTLVAQLRRAASAVPLNIAEEAGCASGADFARFLNHAYRSLKEIVTGLELCLRLYPDLSHPAAPSLVSEADQIARMIYTLMQRLGWTDPSWRDE